MDGPPRGWAELTNTPILLGSRRSDRRASAAGLPPCELSSPSGPEHRSARTTGENVRAPFSGAIPTQLAIL